MKRPSIFERWLLGLILSTWLAAPFNSSEAHEHCAPSSNPVALYGGPLVFDVLRNDSKVGQHRVSFERDLDGHLRVVIDSRLRITLLGLTVYQYGYESTEQWCADRLVSLWARQDDDGDRTEVQARTENGMTTIEGPSGNSEVEAGLFPTNHWNAHVLSQSRVINTLSGEVSQVLIHATGRELVEAEGLSISASRYRYTGDIDTSVWYDDAGRWVKMRFAAKGGSVIEYRCVTCGQSIPNTEVD